MTFNATCLHFPRSTTFPLTVPLHALAAAIALAVPSISAAADTIYVSYSSSQLIEKFTINGVGTTFATGLGTPYGLALDSTGNLYAACVPGSLTTRTIFKITPLFPLQFANTGLENPEGLAFDRAGNLYAAITSSSTIMKFTPGGVGSVFASTGLDFPAGLAFDSAGNLYAANAGDNTIEKFTPSGVGSRFASDPGDQSVLNEPVGLAFDSVGNLYASNEVGWTIEKFTPDGVGSLFAHTGGSLSNGNGPAGLAFDSSGNLYAVIQGNNTIEKYTPAGVGSIFASTGANTFPSFIAIQTVAEPSSLALAGCGLAMVAVTFVCFRRQFSESDCVSSKSRSTNTR